MLFSSISSGTQQEDMERMGEEYMEDLENQEESLELSGTLLEEELDSW